MLSVVLSLSVSDPSQPLFGLLVLVLVLVSRSPLCILALSYWSGCGRVPEDLAPISFLEESLVFPRVVLGLEIMFGGFLHIAIESGPGTFCVYMAIGPVSVGSWMVLPRKAPGMSISGRPTVSLDS